MKEYSEKGASLAFLPIAATFGFYILPQAWKLNTVIQFLPQACAYLCLGLWSLNNTDLGAKLGLRISKISPGLKWGMFTGLCLGGINATIILFLIPAFDGDITFLLNTPHARVPFWVMVPGFILFIACAVELNFRGFLLGRLLAFFPFRSHRKVLHPHRLQKYWVWLSLLLSSVTFSFDPYMVATFGTLHWIAIWDGLIWGWMWIRLANLYAVIIAHTVEVIILYLTIRSALLLPHLV